MDFHKDGIDLISHYGHQANSVLVTARADESRIQTRCLNEDIKLLPKNLVSEVKVVSKKANVVLIDDERLVHLNWSRYCQKRGIELKSYYSVEDFLKSSAEHLLDTPIYIDSVLGQTRGEVESRFIADLGSKNLYMATGYQKEDIAKPEWILEIFSKSPEEIFIKF